jgi:hypothetical protein
MLVLLQRRSPAEAEAALEPLLGFESTIFVLKLYRTIIFEVQRQAEGL